MIEQAKIPPAPKNIRSSFHRLKRLRESDFIRKVMETFATKIALLILGIATSILITRSLGPAGRGTFAVAATIGAIGLQFGNLGLSTANTYFAAKDRSLLSKLLGNSLFVSFAGGTAGLVLTQGLSQVWPALLPIRGMVLLLALAAVPFGLAALFTQNILLGIQDVRGYNKYDLLNAVITLCCILALTVTRHVSAAGVLSVSLAVGILSFTLMLRRCRSHFSGRLQGSPALLKSSIGYGIKFYLANFFAFLVLRSDMILVDNQLGKSEAGIYSIAITLANLIAILPGVVGSILFPRMSASDDPAAKWRETQRALLGVGAITGAAALVSAIFAAPFTRIAYGPDFVSAVPAYLWLLPGTLFLGLNSALSAYVGSVQIPWRLVGIYVATFLLNLALNLLFLRRYGIVAASVNSSVCYGFSFIALWLLVARPMVNELKQGGS